MPTTVAFLGLGAMGRAMASNLARAGFSVRAWNRTPRPYFDLVESGVVLAQSAGQAVEHTQFVCVCVLNDEAVEAVMEQILPVLEQDAVIIDHSTIAPSTARRATDRAAGRGASYLDAPVSGGVAGAESATLTIMVGGNREAFQRALPVLHAVGTTVEHLGPSGSGQSAKLVNQLLTTVHSAVAVEALHLGMTAGLDLSALHRILSASYGASRMLERIVPRLASRDFNSPFRIDLLAKDLDLILHLGDQVAVPLPFARTAHRLYRLAKERHLGPDAAALIELFEEGNGADAGGEGRPRRNGET
jgi:3-hydroxyisobutyrate dehydrogenase-like beta-hydroxyacid dehydrogenase